MKKSIQLSLLVIVFLCIPLLSVFSQSTEEIKSKIETLNASIVQAMLKGDSETTLKMYTNDAISLPSYEPMLVGIDAIRKSNENMARSGVKIVSFDIKTLNVFPSGNLVVEIGTYSMAMTMAGSDQPMSDKGKYITVWEKQSDGSLKIKIETWNSDINPWAQMQKEM